MNENPLHHSFKFLDVECLSISVPAPNLYVNVSPLLLIVDVVTILWLNAFGLGLQQAAVSLLFGPFFPRSETQSLNSSDMFFACRYFRIQTMKIGIT